MSSRVIHRVLEGSFAFRQDGLGGTDAQLSLRRLQKSACSKFLEILAYYSILIINLSIQVLDHHGPLTAVPPPP